ncbi:hypothetical protein HQ531_07265 [bacterium]|nr:hypothetical protein [bacterium]
MQNLLSAKSVNIPIEKVCPDCISNFNQNWSKKKTVAPIFKKYRPSLGKKWFPIFYEALIQDNITEACRVFKVSRPAYREARRRHSKEYCRAQILASKSPSDQWCQFPSTKTDN